MYSVEKTRGINYVKQFDYLLFFSVLLLSIFGLVVLYSATRVMPSGMDGDRKFKVQAVCLVIGVIASIVVSLIDYKDIKTLGIIFYIVSIALLALVFIKGVEINYSKSWLRVPIFGTYQPSELAKVTFIIFISIFFERIKDGQKDKTRNIAKLVIYTLLPVGFIMKQPDDGTAMVFIFVFAVMVFICDLEYKYIAAALGTMALSMPILWFFVLKDYQKERILAFLIPDKYMLTSAYNTVQAKMAVGSGLIFGQGFLKGIQTQSTNIPVKESDFIFSAIGEEFGFIGAIFTLAVIVVILIRCIYIAKNARDSYGSFIVTGITAMFGFHFIENIGMCIGILPVTGIPLPFVSSGGTALFTYYIALGILLSVSMRRKKVIFNSSE